jgi:hypothetical protein
VIVIALIAGAMAALVVQAGLEEQSAEPAERDITPANAS